MQVGRAVPAMPVLMMQVHADQVELAVVHPALRTDRFGKATHGRCRPAQQHGLQAVFVVQVHVGGGQGEIVVVVLLSLIHI